MLLSVDMFVHSLNLSAHTDILTDKTSKQVQTAERAAERGEAEDEVKSENNGNHGNAGKKLQRVSRRTDEPIPLPCPFAPFEFQMLET